MNMDVSKFKDETGVPEQGVCVRGKVPVSGRATCPYYVFVDGSMLTQRYTKEEQAYQDADVIRRALRSRVVRYASIVKWIRKYFSLDEVKEERLLGAA